eukprot:gnl/MRDRNA2_/MRDRNA2_70633_c0_seq1.p1 gnl/MRDRNA2_/MRDRNA2_70633_c0~~gnl/MRDRNA2_/MRDRNA2_70633_c0_seq1.p1  ORF type:complete len:425 (-),score=81.37 gnl/MRDRNA2_/MRDRNA2_70633_c0_seq1:119-1393(-)
MTDLEAQKNSSEDSAAGVARTKSRRTLKRAETKHILETETLYAGNMRVAGSGHKIITYNPEVLSSFRIFIMFQGTVFLSKRIWILVASLVCVALSVMCIVIFCVPSPKKLSTERFAQMSAFLKVFIAFMLGLFLNNALQRWWNLTMKVTEIMLSIKKMIYCLNSVGAPAEPRDEIQRLCIVAVNLWICEVHTVWLNDDVAEEEWESCFTKLTEKGILRPHEHRFLLKIPAEHGKCLRATSVFAWVGQRITDVVNEHSIPPPIHARLMVMANDADDKINLSKIFSQVQMPFMYTHMLAVLVHVNNLLVAITCGLTMGSAAGELYQRQRQAGSGGVPPRNVYTALQVLVVNMIIMIVNPLLYQAFLQIAATLCYPFGDHGESWARLPLQRYLNELEEHLNWMSIMDHRERKRAAAGPLDEEEDEFS